MRIAAIQMPVMIGQAEQNKKKAAQMIEDAARQGAKLVLLPELWPCGFAMDQLEEMAENMRGSNVGLLRKLAKEHKIAIIGGSLPEKKDGKLFNTSVAINEAGEIIAKYRKAHLFPHGLREDLYFSQGDEWGYCQWGGLCLGMLICYDAFFPELSRNLCLRGAELLAIPLAVPHLAIEDFHILAQARALENQCFVIMTNHADNGGDKAPEKCMAGRSLVVSPYGIILAEADTAESILLADLQIDELKSLRERRFSLNDRRNILDEIDNSQL